MENIENDDIDLKYNIEAISKELINSLLDNDNDLTNHNNKINLQHENRNPDISIPTTLPTIFQIQSNNNEIIQDTWFFNTDTVDDMVRDLNVKCVSIYFENSIYENGFCNIYAKQGYLSLPTAPLTAQIARSNVINYNSGPFQTQIDEKCQKLNAEKLSPLYLKDDVVHIDFSKLDLINFRKEKNELMRLLSAFRDVYNAISETPLSPKPAASNLTVETFLPPPTIPMPSELNICIHIEQAIAIIWDFIHAVRHTLKTIGCIDMSSHAQCESNLTSLCQYITQLEEYEYTDFDHFIKNYIFVTDEIRSVAKNLEKVLEDIAREIRNIQMRIIAYIWYSNQCLFGAPTQEDEANNQPCSGLGVIRDILQK